MFAGHFGLGFAAKRAAPKVSLGTLFIAVQLLDLLWPTLLLLGVEHVVIHPELGGTRTLEFSDYPYTHSLLCVLILSSIFGGLYWLIKKDLRSALILGVGVLSHWILDLIVHFHDLPLYPGNSPFAGLGLWGSMTATIIIESVILFGGFVIYIKTTATKNKTGIIVPWTIIILLVLIQVSSFIGPPPENVEMLAWSAQFQWLFVLLAYWADGNRTVRSML